MVLVGASPTALLCICACARGCDVAKLQQFCHAENEKRQRRYRLERRRVHQRERVAAETPNERQSRLERERVRRWEGRLLEGNEEIYDGGGWNPSGCVDERGAWLSGLREVKTDRAGWNVSEFVSKRGAWLTALHHVFFPRRRIANMFPVFRDSRAQTALARSLVPRLTIHNKSENETTLPVPGRSHPTQPQ